MTSPDAAHDRPVRTAAASGTASASTPTTDGLRRFGRRYPAVGRVIVSVLCAAAGPFAAPPEGAGIATAAAVFVVVWNLGYLAMVLPDGHGRGRLVGTLTADLVLLCGLCLAQTLLVDPALLAASLGWVSPMASFTVVAVQFTLRPPASGEHRTSHSRGRASAPATWSGVRP
jgi:hypothetical protein